MGGSAVSRPARGATRCARSRPWAWPPPWSLTGMSGSAAGVRPRCGLRRQVARRRGAPTRSCPRRPAGRRRCGPSVRTSCRSRRATGRTGRELAEDLRADRTLWVDECGALFFQDELPADLEPAPQSAEGDRLAHRRRPRGRLHPAQPPGVAAGPVPGLRRAPDLRDGVEHHVRAGHVDGAAFSTDADPTTFSDAERDGGHRRVATSRPGLRALRRRRHDPGSRARMRSPAPGSTDPLFGTRVLISPDATQSQCGCGGRAYVDVVRPHLEPRLLPAGVGLPAGAVEQLQVHRRGGQPRGRAQLRPEPRRHPDRVLLRGQRWVGPDHGLAVQPAHHAVEQRHLRRVRTTSRTTWP